VLFSHWRTQLNDMSVGIASLATGETRELIYDPGRNPPYGFVAGGP